jgi:hypothetical protein
MKKILAAFLLLLPSLVWGQTPTLVQSYAVGRENTNGDNSTQGYTNPQLKIPLPNPSLAGNCLVLGISANSTVLTIGTPSDDKGNTWVAGPTITANGLTTASFYALNIAAGTKLITVTFTGTVPVGTASKLSDSVQEFYNCQVSGAIGPTGTVSSASPVNVTLSGTPALGDLVWFYAEDSTFNPLVNTGPAVTSITPGANFVLDVANVGSGKMTEHSTSTTSTTAGFTTTSGTWTAVALTLHAASAGSVPSGIRIVHEQGEHFGTTPHTMQFPSTQNFIVGAWLSPDVIFSAVSSSPANTWNLADKHPTVCCTQNFYALSATSSTGMTITPTYSGSAIGHAFVQLYDIAGAPSWTHDAVAFNNGTQTTNTNLNAGSITPSQLGEFILSTTGLTFHSMLAVVTDANGHTPIADFTANTLNDDGIVTADSTLNDDDGRSHIINTDLLPISFIYSYVYRGGPTGVQGWNTVTTAFKAATSSQLAPPTNLKATVQ